MKIFNSSCKFSIFHDIDTDFCLLDGGAVNKAQLFAQITQWLSFICIPFANIQIIFDAPLQIVVAYLPSSPF
jgi:enhancing lycopene biosynthesis protein 2